MWAMTTELGVSNVTNKEMTKNISAFFISLLK